EYDIGHSILKGKEALPKEKPVEAIHKVNVVDNEGTLMLFTTKTCPNCKIAGTWLQNAGFEYDKIDAEENVALTKKYAILQAPTLVVCKKDGCETYSNASNIRKYIESVQKA
ncbi:MAG: thioredoxin domain-containing protein, partial [Longicatena sp.]